MSLYDVSRLTGSAPLRGVARDTGSKTAAPSTPALPAANGPVGNGVAVETGARVAAGQVPVDQERVDMIRQALREGTYPIVPAKITDAMIAARLMLSSN